MVEPSSYSLAILMALSRKREGEVYQGTVSYREKLRRRVAGKRAKAARKANR